MLLPKRTRGCIPSGERRLLAPLYAAPSPGVGALLVGRNPAKIRASVG